MKKIILLFLQLLTVNSILAQCTASSFNVNFSAAADTSWTLTHTVRGGVCCSSSNCVTFNVTLNSATDLISFDVTNPSPSGSAFYQVNCGAPVSIGTPFCVAGMSSPFTITYCKPGGDKPDYIIQAGSVAHASGDITIHNTGCSDTLFVTNVQTSSIQWTSIYPGAAGAYNSYLSCTSGCNSTIVTAGSNPPPYIDFMVSGLPNTLTCGTIGRDTVRVNFVNDISLSIIPPSPVTCSAAGTAVTLTASPSGGLPPYTYLWSTGATTQSISTSSTGTYTVTVSDHTQCPSVSAIKTLATLPSAAFTYPSNQYCRNAVNPLPVYSGTGQPGTFTSSPAGLVFVSSSTGEINLLGSVPGNYTVTNTVAPTGPCPGSTASFNISIKNFPVMTSPSSVTICTGTAVSLNLNGSMSSAFQWIAGNNPNTTGESTSIQTTNVITDVLLNPTSTSQIVTYTVTPISTVSGCAGPSQIVSVTVNPKDNASFSYSSSTFCKTGINPSPTVTGLSGGVFAGSSGLSINSSTGVINLSSTPVGSYVVTYTTNGTCPNSSAFAVTVSSGPSPAFSYSAASYCQSSANPSPVFPSGSSGGTFSSTAGLVFISSATGLINLAASAPGTYTVTNTIAASGGCGAVSATTTVTINGYNPATFSYPGTPYCQNAANPSPVYSGGASAGTFSSSPGLSINVATGVVNLAASSPGIYTVTNTVAANGSCPSVSASNIIRITALPVSTFSYSGTPYCENAGNPLPTFSGGGVAGTFTSSSVFLSLNSSSGLVNISSSIPDDYLVTNTIAAANGCPAVFTTVPISITELPDAAFSYVENPYCQDAPDPTPVLNVGGSNGIYTASPSGLNIEPNSGTVYLASSTAGTYTVTNTIAAANGCAAVVETAGITITQLTPASFVYSGSPYCKNAANPSPTFTGGAVAGTFTAPAGLIINSSTGVIDLAASTPGTYTVTNTTPPSNGCNGTSATASITITPLPVATFNYPGTPYCQNSSNPSPVFTGGGVAGTFSAPAGLSINPGNGVVNLAASTPGTYTVTNTIAASGGCPAVTASASITITPLAVATFSYTGTPYCDNGSNPAPIFSGGGTAGTFTASAGLNINAGTGIVNLAASTAGTYTVTNTIAASGGCPVVTATATITITDLPVAAFSYIASPYCQNGSDPLPTFSGAGVAGTFTSPAGLNINAGNGLVNLAASASGTYTVTNTIAASGGCPVVTASSDITISPLPVATFNYPASPYCQNGGTASPLFSDSGIAGTFTSAAALTINSSTGVIDLAASTPGTYTVTNTIDAANGCPAVTATASVTVSPLPVATFSYTSSPYCQNESNPLPTFSGGGTAGIFSASSGLSINGSNGEVDLAASTAGTYTVTNTIDAANGCPVVTATSDISITNLPDAAFSYTASPYCQNSGNPFPLLNTGSTAGTFMASSGLMLDPSTGEINLSGSTPGNYTVSNIIAAADGCPSVTATAGVAITALPVAAFSYPASEYCQDGSNPIPVIPPGALAGTFYAAGGLSINSSTGLVILSTSATGTYTIANYIAPAGGCPAVVENFDLTINPAATANAGVDTAVCAGSSYTLSGTIGGGASALIWTSSGTGSFDNNTLATATYLPSSADIAAGAVTLTITTNDPAGPCGAMSDQMILTIEPAAIANASSDDMICSGTSYALSGMIGGSASSLTWSSSGSGNFDNTGSVTAIYTPSAADIISGNIILTLVTNDPSGFCPAVSDSMLLAINPAATADAGSDAEICEGSTYILAGVIGGGASTLAWSGDGTGTFDNASSATAIYTPSAADISAGSVTLTITTNDPAGPCGAVSDAMTLIIKPMPLVNAGNDIVICAGNICTFSASIGGGASGASWTTTGNGSFDNASSLSANYSATAGDIAAGSLAFVLTSDDPAGACSAVSDTVMLTINQVALLNAGSDQTICEGTESTLSGSFGGAANAMIWTTSGSGTFDNTSSINAVYTPSVSDVAMGSVIITGTSNDPAGPCPSVTDEMILSITPRDNPSFSYSSSTFCVTGSDPSPAAVFAGGTYSASPVSLVVNPSSGTIDLDASPLGNYLVNYITSGVCPDSSFVNITITDGLYANFSYTPSAYCSNAGDPLPLLASGANSGTFSSSAGLAIDPVSGMVDLSASVPGTYTVTNSVAASGGCAAASSTDTITINQQDNASFSYSAPSYCHSSADQLPTITGNPGGSFSCSASGLSLNTFGTINISGSAPGTYTIIYTTNGVCYNSDSANVTINSLPLVDAGDERLIDCGANPINIDVLDASGNIVNYSWNTNGGNILSGNGTNALSVNQTGVYYVTAINTFGCTSCDTVIVNESPVVPEASFTSAPMELTGIVPFQVNFANESQNANTYSWTFGDGSPGTGVFDPDYTFTTPGTYTVTLVASNNGRCADTARVTVNVEDQFSIPEAFSPNGDGINDVFVIKGIDRFKGNQFVVFNRWGNQVFKSAPYDNEWDGSTKQDVQLGGNELPVGTYFYVLDLGDGSKPYQGYIYLNR
jgi:gliding motility-associated-like protein